VSAPEVQWVPVASVGARVDQVLAELAQAGVEDEGDQGGSNRDGRL
jgi:hypothetical protein